MAEQEGEVAQLSMELQGLQVQEQAPEATEDTDKIRAWWAREEALSLEERRARYACGANYVRESDIKRWSQTELDADEVLVGAPTFATPDEELNSKVAIWQGNITALEIDAIVNAANNSLLGGGGVDGAIHRAAGNRLVKECYLLNGCETGGAKITRGYSLPAKYVIHTVGPIGERPKELTNCYERSLNLAAKHGLRSIAFCGISTGVYGYPLKAAIHIAYSTVRRWLETGDNRTKMDLVIFCVFMQNELNAYRQLLPGYFPKPEGPKPENEDALPPVSEAVLDAQPVESSPSEETPTPNDGEATTGSTEPAAEPTTEPAAESTPEPTPEAS